MRYFIALILILCLFSCANDQAVEVPTAEPKMPAIVEKVEAPSVEDKILFDGTWSMTKIEGVEGADHFLKDALKQFGTCTWDFQPKGSFVLQMGENKAQGQWSLDEAEKTLTTKIGRSETAYEVRNLSTSELRLYLPAIQNELIFERK